MSKTTKPDTKIELGGKTYAMRATFEVLCAIEKRLGIGVNRLPQRFVDERFGLREMTAVVHSAIDTGAKGVPSYESVGKLLVADGVISYLDVVAQYLAVALSPTAQDQDRV